MEITISDSIFARKKMSEVLDTSVGSLKASYHHASKKVEEFILREN